MTTFNFSTGNPANLTAGGGASMTDIQGPFNDLKSFLNGGSMDETNLPNLSAAFTTWKTIAWPGATPSPGGAGTFLLSPGASSANAGSAPSTVGSTGSAALALRLDPTDYAANVRTTKYRIRWQCITNSVAPGVTITPGMYQVGGFGGGSGVAPTIASLGAVVSGSTAAFATPGASSNTVTLSTEFNAPAVLDYCFAVVVTGAFNAGAVAQILGQLQMRQV